jgi:signal transduction histidine kinase
VKVIADLEVRLEQAGGRIDLAPLPTIDADPMQMRQLLQNLLGNALKFSSPESRPAVRLTSSSAPEPGVSPAGNGSRTQYCQLIVEDNGIGFDEQYLDRIFVPFQRLHGRGEYEGTGIGLAICRKIAERHSGQITARSTPGQGATFIVTLPVSHPKGEHRACHKPEIP